MRVLWNYLKPFRGLVILSLLLAGSPKGIYTQIGESGLKMSLVLNYDYGL